jgi:hypothetical protein
MSPILFDVINIITLFNIRLARIHEEILNQNIKWRSIQRDLETKYKMHPSVIF